MKRFKIYYINVWIKYQTIVWNFQIKNFLDLSILNETTMLYNLA